MEAALASACSELSSPFNSFGDSGSSTRSTNTEYTYSGKQPSLLNGHGRMVKLEPFANLALIHLTKPTHIDWSCDVSVSQQ